MVGGERLVVGGIEPKDWSAPGPEVSEDPRCLADHQLVRETKRWSYDDAGRLTAYASIYHDCEGTRARNEELIHGDEIVEVKVDEPPDPSGSRRRSLRYHLDDFGRVVAIESDPGQRPVSRYTYDERGRLIHAVHGYGEQRWSYEAAIVGSEGSWMLDVSQDSRTIRLLNGGGGDDHIYEIRFDERQRVVAIEAANAWLPSRPHTRCGRCVTMGAPMPSSPRPVGGSIRSCSPELGPSR